MKRSYIRKRTDNSEWVTPQPLFDRLNEEFKFDLDVCATHENAKCKRYFTKPESCTVCGGDRVMSTGSELDKCAFCDGLSQPWGGTVWMNPPYGREIGKWMRKAYEEAERGTVVVALIPARTNAPWWHDVVMKADEIRFIRKKVSFGGRVKGVPFFGSVIAVFRYPGNAMPDVSSYEQTGRVAETEDATHPGSSDVSSGGDAKPRQLLVQVQSRPTQEAPQ